MISTPMTTAEPAADSMASVPAATATFAYEAQTEEGQRLSGTIEAPNIEWATDRLRLMRLRVIDVRPTARPGRGKPLSGDEFIAFNQQLAQLTAAGLPVEQGLRLIAIEIRGRRLRRTIEQLSAELERGTPLDQAFDKYAARFPPLYGRLIRAGIKSGNLSGVLFGLGRHLDLVQRLRSTLWRALSYPLLVLVSLGCLLSFLGIWVLPQFQKIYAEFRISLPASTEALLSLSRIAPALLIAMLALLVVVPVLWRGLQRLGYSIHVAERIFVPVPLIGPVLRFNLVARWCDAMRVAVEAGLDLQAAFDLAADATRSSRLARDGIEMASTLSQGMPLTSARTRLLPATVPAAMQFASGHHDLPSTLNTLSDMYQRQAELRLNALPGILTPILVLLIAIIVGFVVIALLAPLLGMINGMTGGSGFKGIKL